jgi:hypothetical protein
MKTALSFLLAAALVCAAAPASYAEPRQVMQGTQVHLTLLSGINSAVSREGDCDLSTRCSYWLGAFFRGASPEV